MNFLSVRHRNVFNNYPKTRGGTFMNAKDWVSLILPIVLNGTIVFFFHLYITSHLEKKTDQKEARYRFLNDFHNQLTEILRSAASFAHSLGALYNNTASKCIVAENESMNKFRVFCEIYQLELASYTEHINTILFEAKEVIQAVLEIKENHHGVLNSDSALGLATHHNNLVDAIQSTTEQCCNELDHTF